MQRIKEVIIIRAADPDGSMFRAIKDALRGRRAEVIELAAPSHDNSLPMLQTVFYLCSGFSQAETLSCRRAAVAGSIATSTSKSCSPSSAPLLLA